MGRKPNYKRFNRNLLKYVNGSSKPVKGIFLLWDKNLNKYEYIIGTLQAFKRDSRKYKVKNNEAFVRGRNIHNQNGIETLLKVNNKYYITNDYKSTFVIWAGQDK